MYSVPLYRKTSGISRAKSSEAEAHTILGLVQTSYGVPT